MSLVESCLLSSASPYPFRWDWYQATLPAHVEASDLIRWVDLGLGGTHRPGLHSYEHMQDYGYAKVMWGGAAGSYGPHLIIHGGDECPYLASSFREHFPEHRVSRFDVALDFDDPKAFDLLVSMGLDIANMYGLKTNLIGDWIGKKDGRTLYIGGMQSTHRIRIYEKGHEQRKKGVDCSLSWVRVELVCKPERSKRVLASKMTCPEVAFSCPWTSEFYNLIFDSSCQGIKLTSMRKKTPVILSLEAMFHQYASVLHTAVKESHISKESILSVFERVIDEGIFNRFRDSDLEK